MPDAGGVVLAYLEAREWINVFDPPGLDSPEAQLEIERAAGVCIVLRQSGRIVGVGLDQMGGLSRRLGTSLAGLSRPRSAF